MTIQQIQTAINSKANDPRQLINMIADYLQANPGGSSPIGSSYLVAEKELTNNEVINLPITAIELIAAPGSGKAIIPISTVMFTRNWVQDYASIDANCAIQITGGGGGQLIIGSLKQTLNNSVSSLLAWGENGLAVLSAQQNYSGGQTFGASGYDADDFNDSPLKIEANNGITGIFTGGDASTKLKVVICYMVLDL